MTNASSLSRLRDHLVALTRDLILMPSTAIDAPARQQCYEFVRNHLEDLPEITIHDYVDDGAQSLVATPTRCSTPDILFVAHLDVVAHPDPAAFRSTVVDGRIVGPGAGDMKGALAILIVLFRRFHRAYPGVSLGLAVTTDEETGGEHGIGFLVRDRGLRCGLAMIPDGGSLHRITVEEKGIIHLRLQASGHPAHAARPWLGRNPLPPLIHALTRLETAFAPPLDANNHWYPTCAITSVGTENATFNRLPAEAHAMLDIRFPPPHTSNEILELVRQCVGPDIELIPAIVAEPTHLSPDPLYNEVTHQITGQSAELVRESGGSDARFLHPYGIPVIMARPLVGNLHAPDEWIDIESMVTFFRIWESYLARRFNVAAPAE